MVIQGNRVKELRVKRGMSRAALAATIGAHPTTLGTLERNEHDVSVAKLLAIVLALDTNADYLLGLSDNPAPASDLASLDTVIAKVQNCLSNCSESLT